MRRYNAKMIEPDGSLVPKRYYSLNIGLPALDFLCGYNSLFMMAMREERDRIVILQFCKRVSLEASTVIQGPHLQTGQGAGCLPFKTHKEHDERVSRFRLR
jgi:hypothetical protein